MVLHFGSSGEKELQKRFNTTDCADAFYKNQMVDHLNPEMIRFIKDQEMLFIATADKKGNCDSSFRYGEKGFIKVINEKTVAYPEYKGNGVNASLGNIFENPHIGLLILDFYECGIGLHINGKATICEITNIDQIFEPSQIIESMKRHDNAIRWVAVEIEEAYIHCSKHIPLLQKKEKAIQWGTDDTKLKGGDFFKVKKYKKINI